MYKKHLPRFILVLFFLALLADFSLSSCASRGNPSGGKRDTLAPQIDTTFPPNFSTGFNSGTIEILFDEYITMKGASQQIRITPPMPEDLEIDAGFDDLSLELNPDSLLPNTTYTITFGTSITDFTEGNVQDKFTYVFSTGTYIDSLKLSGTVKNTSGEPMEGLLVALYEYKTLKAKDSIPYKALPTYYTYTSENGSFKLQNLKYGKFAAVAFEDKGGKFAMLSNSQTTAFLSDTLELDSVNKPLNLTAFEPEGTPRFVSARHVSPNRIRLAFSGNAKNTTVSRLYTEQNKKAPEDYLEFAKSDTLFYWFQDATDSIVLRVQNQELFDDTAIVSLREYPEKTVRFSMINKELAPGEKLYVQCNVPILSTDKSGFVILTNTDTLRNLQPEISDTNSKVLVIPNPPRAKSAELLILKTGVIPFTGSPKDSLFLGYNALTKEDVGNAIFKVVADSANQYIVKVMQPGGGVVAEKIFTGSTSIKLKNLKPEKYNAQLIIDRDKNGRWSSGDYLKQLQPEKIVRYNEALEIRANWDLEIDWLVDKNQLSSEKESASFKKP